MDPSGGYQEFPFISEFYDSVVPYRDRQDVSFYVEMARKSGGPVLELGCGTGRVLIPTAQAGIEITGLDYSERMLSFCRQKLSSQPKEAQERVELVQGDMRQFGLGQKFNLVTIPFRPFQHLLTVEDQMACLQCIHSHLFDQGYLIFDMYNPHLLRLADEKYLQRVDQEPPFVLPDGRRIVRKARTPGQDLFNQIREVEFLYDISYPDGREEHQTASFKMRYIFRFEAEHLLARAGLRVEKVYSDFDKSPYGSKYPGELIFVAQKV